ncbi:MAG: hypothetical protein HY836_04585 [Aquabacterium sp.]|uniref:carbohydrate binding domain-containing protein n=1 Tax=Aquabacterium sp. TaxID=1872578 RepID=UPI0025BA33D5|nr:carbohydrate binding domain-containing protein [Aquabacterium sp.]MBI5924854.1 hypothetical protein [Aquabacterium sp.]
MSYRRLAAGHALAGLVALCTQTAIAADYYVNTGSWGDGNPGSQFLPWRTLDKVNSAALQSGDRVLFKKGQVWEGTLKLKNGVTYGSYPDSSTEAAPLIRASSNVGGLNWALHSGQIYVADVSTVLRNETDVQGVVYPAGIGQLIYNGARLQRARYPNIGVGGGQGVFNRGQNRFLRVAAGTPVVDGATSHTMLLESGSVPASVGASDLVGAQVYVKNWPWFMTRYDLKAAASKTSVSVTADATWPGDKSYRLTAGNGYWLENKLWMLDKEGEWVFDAAAKKLYVWLPSGANPSGKALYASSRVHAIEARDVASVKVKGLAVAESRGDAVAINRPTSAVVLDGLSVARAGAMGIVIINNGYGSGSVSNSVVNDSGAAGIYLGSNSTRSIQVTGNTVRNAGLGLYAHAGIWLGHGSVASGNTVERSSYIGIRAAKSNAINNNVVLNSCLEFDDCGGIYARGLDYDGAVYGLVYKNDVGNSINANFVDGALLASAPDRLDGLADVAPDTVSSATNGIYLDDFAGAVTVDGNYVTGFDRGVMLHYGRSNTVRNNKLVGNTRTQLWMQENRHGNLTTFAVPEYCGVMPDCDANNYLRFNTVTGNVLASRQPNPVIAHSSDFAGADDFATYSNNVYATYGTPVFALIESGGVFNKTFSQWVQSGQDTVARTPWNVFSTSAGTKVVAGAANMVVNGGFEQGLSGWGDWHAVSAAGAGGCFGGGLCLTTEPSADAAPSEGRKIYIVNTTSPMTLTQGQTYVLTFDALAVNAGENLRTVLRSMSNFSDKTNVVGFNLSSNWRTYTAIFNAKESLSNARLDFELVTTGQVRIDNVRIVPAQSVSGNAQPVGFYNAGTASRLFDCPVSDAAACKKYVDVVSGADVSFPLILQAKSSRVLVLKDAVWMDADRDGVPGDGAAGGLDRCPGTLDGVGVNESGCAVGQVPLP